MDSIEDEKRTHQSLKRIEEQRQGFTQPPSDDNQDGDDEQRYLDARPDGDAHCQIELSLAGDHDRGGVFRSVGDDWNNDESDPFPVD